MSQSLSDSNRRSSINSNRRPSVATVQRRDSFYENIHQILARPYKNIEELCNNFLKAGCDFFQMETGIVSHIHGDNYFIIFSQSPFPEIKNGTIFELKNTICKDVYDQDRIVHYHDIEQIEHLVCHPVYINLKLLSYISAPIYLDGKIFGTINFTSKQKRYREFQDTDIQVLNLMGQQISNFIYHKLRYETLQNENKELYEQIGILVNNIKNPLLRINSYCQLFQINYDNEFPNFNIIESSKKKIKKHTIENDTKRNEFINNIQNEVKFLTNTVETILKITKSNLDTGKLVGQPVMVHSLIHNVTQKYKNNNKNISIFFKSVITKNRKKRRSSNTLFIIGDENLLEHIFTTLIENAIKFTPNDGNIIIEMEPISEKCKIKFAIKDNGIGISDEKAAQINGTITSTISTMSEGFNEEGFGLGLFMVKSILKIYGNKLKVRRREKKGTCFYFYLNSF